MTYEILKSINYSVLESSRRVFLTIKVLFKNITNIYKAKKCILKSITHHNLKDTKQYIVT